MQTIPHTETFDSTLAFVQNGYEFISSRCRQLDSDIFRTRIMLRPVYCVTGADAAQMFYEPGRFTRVGAMPPTTLSLLQDHGSVLTLDDEEHARRKEMFMALMGPSRLAEMVELFEAEWSRRLAQWRQRGRIRLQDEVEEVLCASVCRWAGIELDERRTHLLTLELRAMIEGAGSVGPRNWNANLLRQRTEHWARELIRKARQQADHWPHTPLQVIARHTGPRGHIPDIRTAAVELLNLLRPVVAVGRYIAYIAHALHRRPDLTARMRAGDQELAAVFVQEVRRYYPFFPVVGGIAREDFSWREYRFSRGDWLLLDLHGTNHDPRLWSHPDQFHPEQFATWNVSPFTFVPQGGGRFSSGHRCAGEWLTIELLKSALRMLLGMDYRVPPQDLRIPLSRMPAGIRSRFIVEQVGSAEKMERVKGIEPSS